MSSFDELGDRVFRRRYSHLDLNVGVVIGEAGTLVIDTRASHREGGELREELRRLTDRPVVGVINTHFHWDHVWGNSRFADMPIWGHVRCRDFLLESGDAMRQHVLAQIEPEFRGQVEEVVTVPPNETLETSDRIHLGDRVVLLNHHGRGHTDSDLVVTVPDADVTFAGDLLEEGAPPSFGDSFPLEWPRTLAAVDFSSTIVPGHGDVVDRAFVEQQRGELEAVAQALRDADPDAIQAPPGPYPPRVMASAWERQLHLAGADRGQAPGS
ncbi:MAG: MBL fold metallo-hydrolase [Acidimicrobiia bacterium]